MFKHIINSYKKTLDFNATSTRTEYITFGLFILITNIITLIIHPALGSIFILGHFPIGVAALTRRLRDSGTSPWLALLAFIPLFNLYLAYAVFFKGSKKLYK